MQDAGRIERSAQPGVDAPSGVGAVRGPADGADAVVVADRAAVTLHDGERRGPRSATSRSTAASSSRRQVQHQVQAGAGV